MNIFWPKEINSEEYLVHSYNKLFIPSSPKKIWDILIRASEWPSWYSNCQSMQIVEKGLLGGTRSGTSAGKLEMKTNFVWRTFGVKIKSQVVEFKPFESLGWDAHGLGSQGFHGWRIIPEKKGAWVITEEVQKGWAVWLLRPAVLWGLTHFHQKWLEQLALQTKRK